MPIHPDALPLARAKTTPSRRSAGAYTLIEMVVVVAIIVVIVAILLPSVGKARESARRVRCVANMDQIGKGLTSYEMDNNGAFPATAAAAPSGSERAEDWIYWRPSHTNPTDPFYVTKSPILKRLGTQDESVLRCPSDDVEARPTATADGLYKYSYVMNYMMTSFPIQSIPGASSKSIARLTGVKTPASKVLLYEEGESTIDDGTGLVDVINPTTSQPQSLLSLRHERSHGADNPSGGRGNVLFCDGHVDLMSRIDLHNSAGIYTNPTK
jgi:prepilin-type processing-associated H-X9-DG protein